MQGLAEAGVGAEGDGLRGLAGEHLEGVQAVLAGGARIHEEIGSDQIGARFAHVGQRLVPDAEGLEIARSAEQHTAGEVAGGAPVFDAGGGLGLGQIAIQERVSEPAVGGSSSEGDDDGAGHADDEDAAQAFAQFRLDLRAIAEGGKIDVGALGCPFGHERMVG